MLLSAVRATVILIALVAVPIVAGAASFAGTWHGSVTMNAQRCTIDVVLAANGSYVQTARCGTLMTQQSGEYKVTNGEIGFSVVSWTPKQRYVVGPVVGSGHWETNAKPPGGVFKYTFTGPNTMLWQDVNFGGSITMQRG